MAGQFGSDYAELRDFKKAFIAELRKHALEQAGYPVPAGQAVDFRKVARP